MFLVLTRCSTTNVLRIRDAARPALHSHATRRNEGHERCAADNQRKGFLRALPIAGVQASPASASEACTPVLIIF